MHALGSDGKMLQMPPRYKAGEFLDDPRAPYGYKGTYAKFALLAVTADRDENLTLLGTPIDAVNVQLVPPPGDPVYPVYFEVTGRTYHYVVNVWADRIVIDVRDRTTFRALSHEFPVTRDEVRRALATIVHDCVG